MIYEDEIKRIIQDWFDPSIGSKMVLMTTKEVCILISGVVPEGYFSEDDVYSILKELNFKQDLHVVYKKNSQGQDTDIPKLQHIVWVMYKK